MVVESNDRSFQECQILKYRRLSPFHVPGQSLRCPTPSVLLITPFCSQSSPSFICLSIRTSLPYPISSSLYRSPLLHFTLGFHQRIFRHPCRKPSCPHFLSRYLSHFPASSGAWARSCLWNHVDITRMPRCVQSIHEPYARILNRLPPHSA